MSSEQKVTMKEQKIKRIDQKLRSNEQQVTSNEQKVTRKEQRAKSFTSELINMIKSSDVCVFHFDIVLKSAFNI